MPDIVYNDSMSLSSPTLRHLRYEALRRSLQETVDEWPLLYQHKIIGKNAEGFRDSIRGFEETYPRLNKLNATVSRNGTYLALTYEILARDVDEIISLWVSSETLKDLVKVM